MKTKTILAAVGGVTLVAVLAAGYFVWSAFASRTAALEGDDEGAVGLETVVDKAERLMRKSVYPGAESVKALTEAVESVEAWKDEAFTHAARGDRRIAPMTVADFKAFIVGDARRLRGLPAGAEKKTLAPEFDFGPFKPYISESTMPEQAQLKNLQRQWDDVATLVEILAGCGVDGISAVEVKTAAEASKEEDPKAKKAKKKPVKKTTSSADGSAPQPTAFTYGVTCTTSPAAFVKAINALATCDRFTVVEDFTVLRAKDLVGVGLGAAEKKDAPEATGTRRRRRSAAAANEAAPAPAADGEAEAPRVTDVTNPAEEPPFETKLTIKVYDFHSGEAAEAKQEGEGK